MRHLLTIASLRKAQLEPLEEKRKLAVGQVRREAEAIAAREPKNLQAQGDLAEALMVEQHAANQFMECMECNLTIGSNERLTESSVVDPRIARRAVAIRKRILAEGPRTPEARWELATTQIELGTALFDMLTQEGPDAVREALASLDELIRDDGANVQYKRDRAQALSLSSRYARYAGRANEAVELGRQAVTLIQQVADTDPRNAGFRLDQSNIEASSAQSLILAGRTAEAMDHLNRALEIQKEQAAAQPSNPDFLVQTALFETALGRVMVFLNDHRNALVHLREAETTYRKLVAAYPEERAYARRLAAQLPLVADSMAGAGDKSGAIPVYQESVSMWEKLSQDSGGDFDSRFGLAKAEASLARGFLAIARPDDAIALDHAAIALFDALASSGFEPDAVRAAQADACEDLALVYLRRNDEKSALQAHLQAVPFLEANHAARPDSYSTYSNLIDLYEMIENDYANLGDAARAVPPGLKAVDLAEKFSAYEPEQLDGLTEIAIAEDNLGTTYKLLDRRAESLAAYRKAAAILSDMTPEKVAIPFQQRNLAHSLVVVTNRLRQMGRTEETVSLIRKAVAFAEAPVRSDPKNERFRAQLREAYQVSTFVASDLNDLQGLIEAQTQVQKLDLERPQQTAPYWETLGKN